MFIGIVIHVQKGSVCISSDFLLGLT